MNTVSRYPREFIRCLCDKQLPFALRRGAGELKQTGGRRRRRQRTSDPAAAVRQFCSVGRAAMTVGSATDSVRCCRSCSCSPAWRLRRQSVTNPRGRVHVFAQKNRPTAVFRVGSSPSTASSLYRSVCRCARQSTDKLRSSRSELNSIVFLFDPHTLSECKRFVGPRLIGFSHFGLIIINSRPTRAMRRFPTEQNNRY